MSTSIIGFDSAWTDQAKAPGAVCVIRCKAGTVPQFVPPRLTRFAEALSMVDDEMRTSKRCLVAIDQPTVVPNAGGSRPVDKVAASLISWLGGGVQPANRSRLGMFDDAAPIWTFKNALGAVEDPEAARTAENGVFIVEVFPALAIPSLAAEFCGRLLGARYNPGRRKTFKLDHWNRLLECTATSGYGLGIDGLGDWCRAHGRSSPPTKSDQDLLDAVLCAIIGYIWMFEARSASLMIGDVATGYMIAPAIGVARERLATAAAARGVRCQ